MSKPRAKWQVFLKPGWIITFILVFTFAYFAFTVLAPWQLHKNTATALRNEQVKVATELGPQPWTKILNGDGSIPDGMEWRQVQLTGYYGLPATPAAGTPSESAPDVLVRMRPVNGAPAYQALTPFTTDEGVTFIVDRGYESATAGQAPQLATAPTGKVTITAYARVTEPEPSVAPVEEDGYWQINGISGPLAGSLLGISVPPTYLQLLGDQPGSLNSIPLPKLDAGPYLSYGIQWIAFGIMAPLGLGYFAWAEIRERRLEQQEKLAAIRGIGAATGPKDPGESDNADPAASAGSGKAPAHLAGQSDTAESYPQYVERSINKLPKETAETPQPQSDQAAEPTHANIPDEEPASQAAADQPAAQQTSTRSRYGDRPQDRWRGKR